MSGAFEPGLKSHLRHYRVVAGGALLLLATGALLGIRASLKAAGFSQQAPPAADQKP